MAKIMSTVSALECKQQGNTIKGFVSKTWNESAKRLCRPGIEAKFHQNHNLMEALIFETGNKVIVEGAKDEVWGSGQPLESPYCLDQSKWTSQGIMGEILCDIREKHWSVMRPSAPALDPPHSNSYPMFHASSMPTPARFTSYGHSIPMQQSRNSISHTQPLYQPSVYDSIPPVEYGSASHSANGIPTLPSRHPESTDIISAQARPMDTERNETN